jgi:hypothetical protein
MWSEQVHQEGTAAMPCSDLRTKPGGGVSAVPAFAVFARTFGFVIDPRRVRIPRDKGKVERRVRTLHAHLGDSGWSPTKCEAENCRRWP